MDIKEITMDEFEDLLSRYSLFSYMDNGFEKGNILILKGFNKMSEINNESNKIMTGNELKEYISENSITHISVSRHILPMMEGEVVVNDLINKSIITNIEGNLIIDSLSKHPSRKEFTFERVDYTFTIKLH